MFDVEKFILAVEKRPPLYDVQSTKYSNKQIKAQCWAEVGEEMYAEWHDLLPAEKDLKGEFPLFILILNKFYLL